MSREPQKLGARAAESLGAHASCFFKVKGVISGRPGSAYEAWAQEAAEASKEAMLHSRDAELAARHARRLKWFAKSARDAALGAFKEMEQHLGRTGDFL